MADSTHRAELVPVKLETHPNADSLSIVQIYDGGFQVVVRTADWEGVDEGVYIQPDSLVPLDNPRFAFLKDPKKPDQTIARIKAKKLRGEWSTGLLVPGPQNGVEWHDAGFPTFGDDVASWLGVTHYDPPEPIKTGGEAESPPKRIKRPCPSCEGTGRVMDPHHGMGFDCEACAGKGYPNDAENVQIPYPCYDVESFRKYGKRAFTDNEPVWITEKIHGSNGRWLFDGERFFCGSRTEWKRENADNLWWKTLKNTPALEEFLRKHPGVAVYGEVCGGQKNFNYGFKNKATGVLVFDIFRDGAWVDAQEAWEIGKTHGLPWVPVVASGFHFNFESLMKLAEGISYVPGADHIREGIVLKPLKERWDRKMQDRVCLKIVSQTYWERS